MSCLFFLQRRLAQLFFPLFWGAPGYDKKWWQKRKGYHLCVAAAYYGSPMTGEARQVAGSSQLAANSPYATSERRMSMHLSLKITEHSIGLPHRLSILPRRQRPGSHQSGVKSRGGSFYGVPLPRYFSSIFYLLPILAAREQQRSK
jgi:hypothetical protein